MRMGNTNEKGSLQNPRPLPVTPTRYEDVLKLDEEESWKERCAVITRPDHEEYVRCAQDILVDLIESLPIAITPEKPDNLEIPSLETRSVSSSDFTPSESSFDTAREELLSLSLLPDLLQPETLHDWRADSDRSEADDYESATDSGEVVADSTAILVAKDDSLNSSNAQDQFGGDREATPVPQLLSDNQLPSVSDKSFSCDVDREKTPVPSSCFLPDLASESFGICEANSSIESVEPHVENTTTARAVETLNCEPVSAENECISVSTEQPDVAPSQLENTVVIPSAAETIGAESCEVVVDDCNKPGEVVLNHSSSCPEVDLVDLETLSHPGEKPVLVNAVSPTEAAEEAGIANTVPVNDTDLIEPEVTEGPLKEALNGECDTVESVAQGVDGQSAALICVEALDTEGVKVVDSSVTDVHAFPTVETLAEQLLESSHLDALATEQAPLDAELLKNTVTKNPSAVDTVDEVVSPLANDSSDNLQPSIEPNPEDNAFGTPELTKVDAQVLDCTFEVAVEPEVLFKDEPDRSSVELTHAILLSTPELLPVENGSLAVPTVDLNSSAGVEDQLESTFVIPAPLLVDREQDKPLDNVENGSPCVKALLESTFVVDSVRVSSPEDPFQAVRDLLPASQEASADIKQLLDRAAKVVADLRDFVPVGASEVSRSPRSRPGSAHIDQVDLPVVQNAGLEKNPEDNSSESEVVSVASETEISRRESNSEPGNLETLGPEPSEAESVAPPFDLDQCLELEATIIAAELINLSLREGEESETEQSMKEKKMADLENNESSRVVGDVAPSLDENVNPFQSKPRVASSPMRAPNANGDTSGEALKTPILGSKGLKNGEVAPKASGARTPTRKTSSPSSRTTNISNSPKRKGSSSLDSGLAEGERENGVGSPFTPSNRLGRSPPRNPARDPANKDHLRKGPVKATGSPPKEGSPMVTGKPPTPGSIDGSGEGFTRCAPEGAPAQAEHDSESDEFKRPLPKAAPRPVKGSSDSSNGSSAMCAGAGPVTNEDGGQLMVRSVEDRVNSEAGPDVAEFADGEFRSAADVFKDPAAFEFLQMAGNKQLSESALARMSLYVKFDPLLKAISPVSRRSLSKGSTSDHSQASSLSEPSGDDLLLGTPSKSEPMLDLSSTPGKGDGCSEGRLLDLTPFKSPHDGQLSSRQYSEEEFAQALRMQELLFQEQLIKKDREWDERTRRQEKDHELTASQLVADNERLVHEFQKLQESHQQMTQIVSEYERTISQLITDREAEKLATDERASQLKKERDQALEDLQSVEGAFADLHRRYEKSKVAVDGFKKNEEVLKTYVAEGQAKVKKQEQKYELLKRHAEEKLECANAEIESLRRSSEAELAALRAQLKKSEMKVNGLERSLETKTKENAELTNICDELIAKVGHGNS